MAIILKIAVGMLIASVILAIIVSKTLKSSSIELVQGKLSDKDCTDDIKNAVEYLKIVNR